MALDPQLVQDLLRTARQRGATAGDALLVDNASFEVQVRLGEVEKVQQSHQKRLGLRLFFGQRSATTSTSDLSEASLRQLLDDTCALAQAMAADPQAGLPDPEETITTIPDLVLWDDAIAQLPVEERTAMAREAERAALDYDSRITNSEGGEYSSSQSHVLYASSHGFVGHYQAGTVGLSVSPIASEAGGMQSDYWFATGRKFSQLQAPAAIGQEARGGAAAPGRPESGDAESARGLRSIHGCQSAGTCVLGSVRLGSVPWGIVPAQLSGHAHRP